MKQLHNKYDKETLKKRLEKEQKTFTTLSFYKYHQIGNPDLFRDHLYIEWQKMGVLGRIYVAHEGINAQICVPNDQWSTFQERKNEITFLEDVHLNVAIEQDLSFLKLAIKVKDKIVADGLDDAAFDPSNSGVHLNAAEFNELSEKENAVVIDMRNHYESEVGHFKDAVTPDVDTFRDSLPIVEDILGEEKERPVLMYCTGGIRCEKASAWFKHKGYKQVYQLKGGIIEYARQVDEKKLDNKFLGKNFVFDERLGERISEDIISNCHQCGKPSDRHTNCVQKGCHLLFIQCDDCMSKFENCCSQECQDITHLPEEEQKKLRLSKEKKVRNVFRKGRSEKLPFKK